MKDVSWAGREKYIQTLPESLKGRDNLRPLAYIGNSIKIDLVEIRF
jgi:hypothetical protein